MPKISFAQQIDDWEALTANAATSGDEHPAFTAVLAELLAALNDARKSRSAHRRLRSKMLVETKRMREAIVRGQDAEQRLRRFLQAVYGPSSPQLHRFGLKPRKKRRKPEASGDSEITDAEVADGSNGSDASDAGKTD
jgi:hypothetical protein